MVLKNRVIWIAVSLLLGASLNKTFAVTSIKPICTNVFEGVVTSISAAEAPFLNSNFLEKVRVTFSVNTVLKGNVTEEKELIVLKNGPVKFKREGSYRVSLNNDLLCSVNEI